MRQLWNESRGNFIGGLAVAAVLAIVSLSGSLYANVGWRPFVIGGLVLLWMGYLAYVGYWFARRGRTAPPVGNENDSLASSGQTGQTQPDEEPSGPYRPCFISYSSRDEAFAERLHADLEQKGVQCWFAPHDLRIGDKIRQTIDRSIREHDKLLLILSKHSIESDWVETEVEAAFEKERKHKQLVLFPIRLDDTVMETDQAWAADIRRTRHIGDFRQWDDDEDDKGYQTAFKRLLRDLEDKARKSAEAEEQS